MEATTNNPLSHLVEAASALADLQPALVQQQHRPTQSQAVLPSPMPAVITDSDASTSNNKNKVTATTTTTAAVSSSKVASSSKREIFPERLMAILNDTTLSDIITWLPHGGSFVIIRPDVFAEQVMPRYFPSPDARTSTKYPSFTRKLNRWGFRQATRGPDTGAFHHPLFRRDQPHMCLDMVCQRSRANGAGASNTTAVIKKKSVSARNSSAAATSSHTMVQIAPLTKESLDAINGVNSSSSSSASTSAPGATAGANGARTPLHASYHHRGSVAASVVTDDSQSEDSQPATTLNAQAASAVLVAAAQTNPTAHPRGSYFTIKPGISSDKTFVSEVLKQTEELERLRIAKVMLYRSYLSALQNQPTPPQPEQGSGSHE